ncbi:MAG: hypothetical protein HYY18_18955 [Planctomycetes bacterium]|nr:hypothetical protein [Planctomycetota bacterium]
MFAVPPAIPGPRRRWRRAGILALAGAVAAGVGWLLHLRAERSAARRTADAFRLALAEGDLETARALVIPPIARHLEASVREDTAVWRLPWRFRSVTIAEADMFHGRQAFATWQTEFPGGRPASLWVRLDDRGRWKVSAASLNGQEILPRPSHAEKAPDLLRFCGHGVRIARPEGYWALDVRFSVQGLGAGKVATSTVVSVTSARGVELVREEVVDRWSGLPEKGGREFRFSVSLPRTLPFETWWLDVTLRDETRGREVFRTIHLDLD